jgi:hypothetical protein
MQRRSAVGRLAAAAAGLSLGKAPNLEAALPLEGDSFSVTRANLAASSGTVTCPSCQEMADSLDLTPAGLCLRCADQNPALWAEPHSNTFWALSPRGVRRLELEIERLSAELGRMTRQFTALQQQQLAQGGDRYNRAMEKGRDRWHALQRELHLLQMLRAASRQYAS